MRAFDTAQRTVWKVRRLGAGGGQSLAVWLLLYAVLSLLPLSGWAQRSEVVAVTISGCAVAAGLLGSLTLAGWHWRTDRPDAATGAYIGAFVWLPIILCIGLTTAD